jgi:Putative transmembrane protein (PGPGW)
MISSIMHNLIAWLKSHTWLIWASFALSLVTLLSGVLVVPWLIVRIPQDYFAHCRPPRAAWQTLHPLLRAVVLVAKNVFGAFLVMAGIIMLFVPGPGIVSILAGLALLDLPGKRTLERRIVAQPRVLRAINKLRARYNHPPLDAPEV